MERVPLMSDSIVEAVSGCRICGERKTIRAHLIPQAFVKEIYFDSKSDEKHMLIHPDKDFKRRSNTGRFDPALLCATCDGRLGVYENSAFKLLKRLRRVKVGKKAGSQSIVRPGTYEFRIKEENEFIRFACGILWKYAALPDDDTSRIAIGDYPEKFRKICFEGAEIPDDIDVFIERDSFSFGAFSDPTDVYFYSMPSVGLQGHLPPMRMSWFSLGGFIVYVRIDADISSDFVPKRCWLRGKKNCHFFVSMRSAKKTNGVPESIEAVRDDLARLNRKLQLPTSGAR